MTASQFFKSVRLVGTVLADAACLPAFLYWKNRKDYAEFKKNHPNAVMTWGPKSFYGFTVWKPIVDLEATREIEKQKILKALKKSNASIHRLLKR